MPLTAAFTHEAAGWSVRFSSTSAGAPENLYWDFGDGNADTGNTATHLYKDPGTYTVTLIAAKGERFDTLTRDILLKEQIVRVRTGYGDMLMYLYNQTPLHRDNFLKLTAAGFYNGTTFHRLVQGFVIQGGDPNSKDEDTTNDGSGGPGYDIEFSAPKELRHTFGAVGAASLGAGKASHGSQFYIVVNRSGAHSLNGNYTVFGHIIRGMEVAAEIVKNPVNANARPYKDIPMEVEILELSREELKVQYDAVIPEVAD